MGDMIVDNSETGPVPNMPRSRFISSARTGLMFKLAASDCVSDAPAKSLWVAKRNTPLSAMIAAVERLPISIMSVGVGSPAIKLRTRLNPSISSARSVSPTFLKICWYFRICSCGTEMRRTCTYLIPFSSSYVPTFSQSSATSFTGRGMYSFALNPMARARSCGLISGKSTTVINAENPGSDAIASFVCGCTFSRSVPRISSIPFSNNFKLLVWNTVFARARELLLSRIP